jgi:acetate kinase
MRILIVNAGSSSLKLSVLDGERLRDAKELAAAGGKVDSRELAAAVAELGRVDAIGHRIVHGGTRFLEAVKVDAGVTAALWELADLAPLHQAKSLTALDAVSRLAPGCPAVACFDTAFHASIPRGAATYALPRPWREQWGLRRFGFHGLSHAYAASRAAELLGQAVRELRIVTCHLGAGASLAAVSGGRSVDTTMGFTPLEGLAMATRSGSVDPGLLLWLLEHTQLTEAQVSRALEHESGMLALAGTADMRTVIEHAAIGDEDARLGLDVYLHRLRSGIAAMASAMNGLDVVVWTGGVGEHAPAIREAATAGLSFLGLHIARDRNETATGDCDLTAPGSVVRSLVVSAREDLEIARQVPGALARAIRD